MKMTKIAFWRKVKENCEKNKIVPCTGIYDSDCPYGTGSKECKMCEGGNGKEALAYAEAYIKRHEQKCKKRLIPKYTADVQPDTTGSELKKIVMKPAKPDPTPLDIAKAIRDNGYNCNVLPNHSSCFDMRCPMSGNGGCGYSHNVENVDKECKDLRKQLIDNYISSHEKPESRPNFRKYLRDKVNMKVRVTPKLSEELQNIAFEESVKWAEGNTEVINIEKPFLYFKGGNVIFFGTDYSIKHGKSDEIFANELKDKEYDPATDTLVEPENAEPVKSTIQCYKCVSVQTCKRKEKELSILPACDGYISNESMNYIHTVDPNEKKVESVLTTTPDMSKPKPLEIAKMIRDNGYVINCKDFSPNLACGSCTTDFCDHILSKEKARASIKKIDDYIALHETVKTDSIINSEPKPIRFDVPDTVYAVSEDYIRMVKTKGRKIEADSEGYMLTVTINGMARCYRTPEEALAVAKKNWGLE